MLQSQDLCSKTNFQCCPAWLPGDISDIDWISLHKTISEETIQYPVFVATWHGVLEFGLQGSDLSSNPSSVVRLDM